MQAPILNGVSLECNSVPLVLVLSRQVQQKLSPCPACRMVTKLLNFHVVDAANDNAINDDMCTAQPMWFSGSGQQEHGTALPAELAGQPEPDAQGECSRCSAMRMCGTSSRCSGKPTIREGC